MKNNPLFDKDFLYELDHYRNRIVYVRILSLTADGYPIEQIEGVATGGTITIDGSSAIRRVISLTMTTKNLNINNIYWGLNASVKVEVGIERKFDYSINDPTISYKDYPEVIWFPQGVYIITEFKTNAQVNNYTITLTGKDKMCLLNGDIGGVFNAETDIGTENIWDDNVGRYVKEKRSLSYVIREMIHHYAKENFGNIIIKLNPGYDILSNRTGVTIFIVEDNDLQLKAIRTTADSGPSGFYWAGSMDPIDFSNMRSDFIYRYTLDEDDNAFVVEYNRATPTPVVDDNGNYYTIRKIDDRDDIGYQLHELDFPDDLIAAAGDTVTSILDKIIQRFPIYEYFYNLQGQFVFQPKATYINTSWNNEQKYEDENFIAPMMVSKKVQYAFDGNQIITTFQNNPQLSEIKNDYTVWGSRTLPSGIKLPIHMRYAIDSKPKYYIAFDKNEETEKPILYTTAEYLEEMRVLAVDIHKSEWLKKKTRPPDYLLNANYFSYPSYQSNRAAELVLLHYTSEELNSMWWDVLEWAEYYKEIFGEYPEASLMSYGTIGLIADFTFPDGSELRANYPGPLKIGYPMTLYYKETGRTVACSPTLIFDVHKDTQAPFLNNGWNPFQHGFHGCSHTYKQFFDRAKGDDHMGSGVREPDTIQSWIFCPTIPKEAYATLNDKYSELEGIYDIKVVDWREIIYQMAQDYYAYGHEENFHIDLFHNNDLSQYNIPRVYTLDGLTNYEQYYHDLEGFWRELYIPYDERDQFLNSQRSLQGYAHQDIEFESGEEKISWRYVRGKFTGIIETNNDANLIKVVTNYGRQDIKTQVLHEEEEKEIQQVEASYQERLKTTSENNLTALATWRTNEFRRINTKYSNLQNDTSLSAIDIDKQFNRNIRYSVYINAQGELVDAETDEPLSFSVYQDGNDIPIDTRNWKFQDLIDQDLIYQSIKEQLDTAQLNADIAQQIQLENATTDNNAELIKQQNLINKYTRQLEILGNMIGPYDLFYSTNINEEGFYAKVDYTLLHLYPIFTEFSGDELALIGDFNKNIVYNPQSLIFWFDFWDANNLGLGQFSVPAIKARPIVKNDTAISALIYQDVPDYLFVDKVKYDKDPNNEIYEGYKLILLNTYSSQDLTNLYNKKKDNALNELVSGEITKQEYDNLIAEIEAWFEEESEIIATSGTDFYKTALEEGKIVQSTRSVTAQEEIDDLLYQHSYINEKITLTTVPVYYLEPNTIISARDELQLVNGYYILNKISVPLTYNGTMKCECIRVPERLY